MNAINIISPSFHISEYAILPFLCSVFYSSGWPTPKRSRQMTENRMKSVLCFFKQTAYLVDSLKITGAFKENDLKETSEYWNRLKDSIECTGRFSTELAFGKPKYDLIHFSLIITAVKTAPGNNYD